MSSNDEQTFAQRTSEQVGKRVRCLDGSGHTGVIVSGDFETGRWQVECMDGVTREFAGPDLQEISS